MKIDKIQTYITPKSTGYIAASGIGFTILSGLTKNATIRKAHKPLAWITIFFTILHAGLIEFYNYKYRGK